jgi:hypothetical protein
MPPDKSINYEVEHDAATDTYTIKGVEVFQAGSWNGDAYGEDDLQAIVDADTDLHALVQPRVKVGHVAEDLKGTDKPAFGWLGPLTRVGGKILADLRHIPKALMDAIKARSYSRVSVELRLNYKHPETGKRYPMVLDALAFLGAAMPAIPTLKPVAVMEQEAGPRLLLFADTEDAGTKAVPASTDQSGRQDAQPSDADAKEGHVSDELKRQQEELDAAREKVKADQAATDAAREAVDEEKRRLHASKIDDGWKRILEEGRATPAEERAFKAVADSLKDATKLEFADGVKGTALDAHIASWMGRPAVKKSTEPKAAGTPEEKPKIEPEDAVMAFAEKVAKDRSISLADAMAVVEDGDEKLAGKYRDKCFKKHHEEVR